MHMTGQNPNVWFQTVVVRHDSIRHDRYLHLPARDAVKVTEGFAYRYISESHDDWKELHRGRLTSSRLSGLLNMFAPPNAKTLGFRASSHEGHRRMLDAYEHLTGATTCISDIDGEMMSPEEAARYNRQAHMDHLDATIVSENGGLDSDEAFAVEEMKVKKARHLRSLGSIERVRMAWGSAQEASTIQTLCERWQGKGRYFMEVGLLEPSREALQRLGFDEGDLPPLGSTPDALCVEATSREVAIDTFASPALCSTSVHVVEVKNSTPFRISKRKKAFELYDRGPRERVDPVLVPQLQLHMLASDASAAYLVSRSATKGTNVFEMQRDDEYIAALLRIVKVFYERYVLRKRVPPKNALSDLKEHKQLLLRTKEIAWRCKLREHIEHAELEGADLRSFLD